MYMIFGTTRMRGDGLPTVVPGVACSEHADNIFSHEATGTVPLPSWCTFLR